MNDDDIGLKDILAALLVCSVIWGTAVLIGAAVHRWLAAGWLAG